MSRKVQTDELQIKIIIIGFQKLPLLHFPLDKSKQNERC